MFVSRGSHDQPFDTMLSNQIDYSVLNILHFYPHPIRTELTMHVNTVNYQEK